MKNLPKDEIIAVVHRNLYENLDKEIPQTNIQNLGLMTEKVESQLLVYTKSVLIDLIPILYSNAEKSDGELHSLRIGDQFYDLVIQQDLLRPSVVSIALINRIHDQPIDLNPSIQKINLSGKFKEIHFIFSDKLEVDQQLLSKIVFSIFQTG